MIVGANGTRIMIAQQPSAAKSRAVKNGVGGIIVMGMKNPIMSLPRRRFITPRRPVRRLLTLFSRFTSGDLGAHFDFPTFMRDTG
jgi:hypothetical protein